MNCVPVEHRVRDLDPAPAAHVLVHHRMVLDSNRLHLCNARFSRCKLKHCNLSLTVACETFGKQG